MKTESGEHIEKALGQFLPAGVVVSYRLFGNGHINDTYLVECVKGYPRYMLQRINGDVFKNLDALNSNVELVTQFLHDKIVERGGDPDREALTLIETKDGRKHYTDERGQCWRLFLYIENSVSYDQVEKPEDFYHSGKAFGQFQELLKDFPAEKLKETIPDFHDTPKRLEALKRAVEADPWGYAGRVGRELDFVYAHEAETHVAMDMLHKGRLPLRVTHNDTKLNNIMFDADTGEVLCVVDLDTIMPGLSIFDFGDSIRFGANTGAEDEQDLQRVSLSLELYELYVKGFLEGCGGSLEEEEIRMLPMGAKLMTLECGIRFLTDYLEGSVYFKTAYPDHNLVRARSQFTLVADMERKWDEMRRIVENYASLGRGDGVPGGRTEK